MQLVEQHVIGRADSRYHVIDRAAFASKNLYNAALYEMRQSFIHQGIRLTYNQMDKCMQQHPAYKALPAKVAQQVLKLLEKNWKAWEEALKEWIEHPEKFQGRPALPKYKDKQKGRNILIYTDQAISKKGLKYGIIRPSMLPVEIKTKQRNIDQVRIVPRHGFYVVEVVYEQQETQAKVDTSLYAGIDIGIDNLATVTSNKVGFIPRLVNGRPVKSINQYYNKRRAELQSQLKDNKGTSNRMERMTNKRTRRIDHYLHTTSRRIIDLLVSEGIGTLVIGKNPNWKQEVEMGKRNNQQFVCIPHARLIEMLIYKAKLLGIQVIVTEESYTSKASFLDHDSIPVYGQDNPMSAFSGKRVKRGLYQAGDGKRFNADVNGSYNIIRKVAPDAFRQGSRGWVIHPVRLHVQTVYSRL